MWPGQSVSQSPEPGDLLDEAPEPSVEDRRGASQIELDPGPLRGGLGLAGGLLVEGLAGQEPPGQPAAEGEEKGRAALHYVPYNSTFSGAQGSA